MSAFGPAMAKRFHYLSLLAQRAGRSPFLAAPRNRLPGGGTEVTGYRDYAPGDDFRQIHWTLCARRDEVLTKVFEGNADLHLYLLVDCSPSMGLGSPAKIHLARQIAALLGYVALMNLDRLGVAAFGDGLVAQLPPLRHRSRLPHLLRFLEELPVQGTGTDFARTAETFVRRYQRHGPVVVLSDLYDPRGFQHGFDILRSREYEPRLVQLYDPRDDDPRLLGDVALADVESQNVRQATITERAARRYHALVAEFRQSVRDYCSRHGIPCMQVACNAPENEVLLRVLGGRPRTTNP